MAAPCRPSSGAPQLPKISAQLAAALTSADSSVAHSTTRVCSSAERWLFSTIASRAGNIPQPAIRR